VVKIINKHRLIETKSIKSITIHSDGELEINTIDGKVFLYKCFGVSECVR